MMYLETVAMVVLPLPTLARVIGHLVCCSPLCLIRTVLIAIVGRREAVAEESIASTVIRRCALMIAMGVCGVSFVAKVVI